MRHQLLEAACDRIKSSLVCSCSLFQIFGIHASESLTTLDCSLLSAGFKSYVQEILQVWHLWFNTVSFIYDSHYLAG